MSLNPVDWSQARDYFRGRNFMTPDVRGYYKLREGYAELSEGRGMGGPIYGVTCRRARAMNGQDGRGDERSKLFHSLIDAKEYIEGLS
jgi:hypothetical protein